jgi:ATP-dependent phosphofructokinase / diphosphate-dependent phosphofructokinase
VEGLIEVKPEKRESLKRWTVPLDADLVRTWDRSGGTRLGTSVINPFDPKKDQSGLVIDNMKKLGLEALVVIGGIDNLGARL